MSAKGSTQRAVVRAAKGQGHLDAADWGEIHFWRREAMGMIRPLLVRLAMLDAARRPARNRFL